MSFFHRKSLVATHNGGFHPDDVFAVASLRIFLSGRIKIIRTRDPKKISRADYVVDVGGIYDSATGRFDHHQRGGAGNHKSGAPYATFGLVWKHLGEKICGDEKIARAIESRLVEPIDIFDNGEGEAKEVFPSIFPYTINEIVDASNLSPFERKDKNNEDRVFVTAVELAEKLINREIIWTRLRFEAEKKIEDYYKKTEDKRVIVLEEDCLYEDAITRYSEPLFVIYQYPDGDWSARAVRENSHNFKSRILFPESWAGKRDLELAEITGVPDAVFCHNKKFMAIAKSKDGAIKLAKIALTLK